MTKRFRFINFSLKLLFIGAFALWKSSIAKLISAILFDNEKLLGVKKYVNERYREAYLTAHAHDLMMNCNDKQLRFIAERMFEEITVLKLRQERIMWLQKIEKMLSGIEPIEEKDEVEIFEIGLHNLRKRQLVDEMDKNLEERLEHKVFSQSPEHQLINPPFVN